MKTLELFWPLKRPVIGQRFGENQLPLYKQLGFLGHNGIDFPCATGEPIYAAHDGMVVFAGEDGKGGYGVVIRTHEAYAYNSGGAYFKTIYWHLLPGIPVHVGQSVMIGDTIGYGDTTGYATGPHLHFGLKPQAKGENDWTWGNIEQNNGYYGAVNPEPYFTHITAYQFRTNLQAIAETIRRIAESVARLIALHKRWR